MLTYRTLIRLLGWLLVVYFVLVFVSLAAVFPKSPPSADIVARYSTLADRLEINAEKAESSYTRAQRGGDTAYARALGEKAHRITLDARGARQRADSVDMEALDPQHVETPLHILKWKVMDNLSFEWRLLLVALFAGMLGAFIHASVSFTTYVGNRAFTLSWVWWYFQRPFVGGGLAVVAYIVFRGALVQGSAVDTLNAYGVGGLAALTGLFSKQAIDKLNEVFTVLFQAADGDAKRGDKLGTGAPSVTRIDPAKPQRSRGQVQFTTIGTGFTGTAVVYLDQTAMTTTMVDPTRLSAELPVAQLPGSGPYKLTVQIPAASGNANDPPTILGPLTVEII